MFKASNWKYLRGKDGGKVMKYNLIAAVVILMVSIAIVDSQRKGITGEMLEKAISKSPIFTVVDKTGSAIKSVTTTVNNQANAVISSAQSETSKVRVKGKPLSECMGKDKVITNSTVQCFSGDYK